jgi:hypothetical protein
MRYVLAARNAFQLAADRKERELQQQQGERHCVRLSVDMMLYTANKLACTSF